MCSAGNAELVRSLGAEHVIDYAKEDFTKTGKSYDVIVESADLAFLTSVAEAGAYRAVIDRTYDFAEIAAAHRHVDTGRKRGNVVVRTT